MIKKITIAFFLLLAVHLSFAQFYLGHQMSFGKNRVQYRNFVWRYMRYPVFDVYYYEGGRPIAYFVAKYAQEDIPRIEKFLDYDLKKRLIFVTYDNIREFKQTNIGLFTGNINDQLAATTQIVDNKIIIYYQDSHEKLRTEVRRAVAEYMIRDMLFGHGFTLKFYTANPMTIPDWFIDGLAAYIANPYDLELDNKMRDLVLHSKYISLSYVKPQYERVIGYSFWEFIVRNYGSDVIPNIMYFSRVIKNFSNAFYYVLGQNLREINRLWFDYLKQKYETQVAGRERVDSTDFILHHFKKNIVYQQLRYNRQNGLYAYVMNDRGRYKVVIYDANKHKRHVIFRQGQRLDQITDFSYPTLAWSPDGNTLAFVTEEHGAAFINYYDLQEKKLRKVALGDLAKIYSINYAPNGRFLALSAQKDGYIDIYIYNIATGILRRITFDPYDDLYPSFTQDSKKIIFSSNRADNLRLKRVYRLKGNDSLSRTFDLYSYAWRKQSRRLKRLTRTPYTNELQVFGLKKGYFTFLSDSTGIMNREAISYDSVIGFVDTAIHYRYITRRFAVTNYPTSILFQDVDGRTQNLSDEKIWNKRYTLSAYRQSFKPNKTIEKNYKPTQIRREQIKYFENRDLWLKRRYQEQIRQKQIYDSIARQIHNYELRLRDTSVDINYYVFEIERDSMLRVYYDYQLKQQYYKEQQKLWGHNQVYEPTFYLTKLSTSFDFGQLVQSYQPFTGGGFVFSPGMNMFTVAQVNELFENYRIFGGFRLNTDFRSVEYLASFEDLSRRLDKQILFHRNVIFSNLGFVGYNYTMTKSVINELILSLRYPFNQVASLRGTFLGRYDRKLYMATDNNVYQIPPQNTYFLSSKLAFIYDNSRKLALNLYDGIRAKAFAEYYKQIGGKQYWTAITGLDFRFYKEIWRHSIFAWRFAASTNTGSGKLIYYLGGVDYWYVLSLNPLQTGNQMFRTDVNINYDNNYIFQAVATPMRGFKQNIRNGTTFLLMNTELRLPVFQMLFNSSVSSGFLYNMQLIGFFDVGSAWCGVSPYDSCNKYNQYNLYNPPITMIVDIDRPPVVEGVGFGLRTKILGYFARFDFAWGIESSIVHPMRFYFSIAHDF